MRKALLVVMACTAIALLAAPQAYAACGTPTPMYHAFGWFNCNDNADPANGPAAPVYAYAYQLTNPTGVNTGWPLAIDDSTKTGVDILCEASNDTTCLNPTAGSAGDGVVVIDTDWSTPGVNGCPVTPTAVNRVIIVVQAADGTGLMASMSGADAGFGYSPDLAGNPVDASLSCGNENARPKVVSSNITSTSVSMILHFPQPRIYSDCDADSLGLAIFGACPDAIGAALNPRVGGAYTSVQPCSGRPDTTLNRWTAAGTPDASGNVSINTARPTASTDCLYAGGTTNAGGVDSGFITGYVSVGNPLPSSPTAENLGVGKATGKINVSWETFSEVGLAGFKLVAVGQKGEFQVGSFVNAKGTASKYSAALSIGDFKGNKGVKVVSVLTDGSTLSSAVKNF